MLIENADYFIRLVPFPPGNIDGCTTPNDDGTFSVYLASNVSRDRQINALDHELNHIKLNHFYSEKPIDVIEREANTGIEEQIVTEPKKSDWLSSWQKCSEWCRKMQEKYGDNPPKEDYPYFVAG